jgi:hypothetical protein
VLPSYDFVMRGMKKPLAITPAAKPGSKMDPDGNVASPGGRQPSGKWGRSSV